MYESWIKAALDELERDFYFGYFQPQDEPDVRGYLYHTLLLLKPKIKGLTINHIPTREYPCLNTQGNIDLALIVKHLAQKNENPYEPRLLAEVKETSLDYVTDNKRKKIIYDINKLLKERKDILEYAKNNMEISARANRVFNRFRRRVWMVVLFRGSGRQGIGAKTINEMEELKKKYDKHDVEIWYGPA